VNQSRDLFRYHQEDTGTRKYLIFRELLPLFLDTVDGTPSSHFRRNLCELQPRFAFGCKAESGFQERGFRNSAGGGN